MTRLFIVILNMSITASYVALAVIAARLLFKKAPKVFSYALWLAVLIRLVCPFSFNSDFSFLSFLKPEVQTGTGALEYVPHNIGLLQSPAIDVGIGSINHAVNTSLPPATPAASVNPMQIFMELAGIIWFAGMVILLVYSAISYLKVLNRVKTATLVRDNISETDRITAPFLCGFIKPKIYVPVGISDDELSYILAHEQTHIHRLDYLIKPFAFSLLSLSVKRSGLLLGSPLAFGESNIKSRIKNILNYKKPAFWLTFLALAVTASLILIFTANPKQEQIAQNTHMDNGSEAVSPAEQTNNTSLGETAVAQMTENAQIEEHLETIISSPKESSNPNDYINAHRNEYESILKMGDRALDYLLVQFEKGSNNGLKGYVMMALCKDLLGDRNNVADNSLSPQDWFSRLQPYKEVKLPDFKANVSDPMEQLVYDAAVKKYARPDNGFTVVAPTIFGSYEEGNKLKIFATVFSSSYKLYNKTLSEAGGSIVPAAITFIKGNEVNTFCRNIRKQWMEAILVNQ